MTLELSRRAMVRGASMSVGATAMSGVAIVSPSLLPDIETRLGPAIMAIAHAECAKILRTAHPPNFGADGRFIMSEAFRTGLTRFLLGEDVVLIRHGEEADCQTAIEAYLQWRGSPDWHVFTTLQTVLWQVVRIAFDQARYRCCAPFYGELRDEPGTWAMLLTFYEQTPRYDLAETTFGEHWIF